MHRINVFVGPGYHNVLQGSREKRFFSLDGKRLNAVLIKTNQGDTSVRKHRRRPLYFSSISGFRRSGFLSSSNCLIYQHLDVFVLYLLFHKQALLEFVFRMKDPGRFDVRLF